MNSVVYNKLVRDNIPKIIEEQGKAAKTRILTDLEYKEMLRLKLLEETNEFLDSGEIEELTDIVEVVRAILDFEQVCYQDFEVIRQQKAVTRGRFADKIFLEEVISE